MVSRSRRPSDATADPAAAATTADTPTAAQALSAFPLAGGAVYLAAAWNPMRVACFSRCVLSGNSAPFGGAVAAGGVTSVSSVVFNAMDPTTVTASTVNVTLGDCQLAGNAATTRGGGVYLFGPTPGVPPADPNATITTANAAVELSHCTVRANAAPAGDGGAAFLESGTALTVANGSVASGAGLLRSLRGGLAPKRSPARLQFVVKFDR